MVLNDTIWRLETPVAEGHGPAVQVLTPQRSQILCRHLRSPAVLFLVTIYNDYFHGITSTPCPSCEETCKELHIALQGMSSRFWKNSHFLDLSLRNDISPYSVYRPPHFQIPPEKKQDCFLLKFFFFSLSSLYTFPSSDHPSLQEYK